MFHVKHKNRKEPTMDASTWFSYQLKASGEGLVWAVEQVPIERQTCIPPEGFGEWNVAQQIILTLFCAWRCSGKIASRGLKKQKL
jgi:hypothetical protein